MRRSCGMVVVKINMEMVQIVRKCGLIGAVNGAWE
jgi:hypothetical protein